MTDAVPPPSAPDSIDVDDLAPALAVAGIGVDGEAPPEAARVTPEADGPGGRRTGFVTGAALLAAGAVVALVARRRRR